MLTVKELKVALSQLPPECDRMEIKLAGPALGLDDHVPGWEMPIQAIKGDGSKIYLKSGHAEAYDPAR